MSLDPFLLEILVCPETKLPVHLASSEELAGINERVKRGALKSRGGQTVSEQLSQALVRSDSKVAYPVRDDVPIMLVEEAIELS